MAYKLTETFHIVFVMAWVAAVFYLPRILVNLAEAGNDAAVRARLVLMGQRLYRFGHAMFGLALIMGLTMWLYFGMTGGWLHAKLTLVLLMFGYFVVCGRMVKRVAGGADLGHGPGWFRWFNEIPVLLLLAIVFLAVTKLF